MRNIISKFFFTLLALSLGFGQVWALKPDLTPTVSETNTPVVPATALDMSTQEFRTPDANGWIVFYTKGVVDQSGITWWSKTQTNGGTSTWSVPTGASAPEAPYLGASSSTNRYTINTSRCHAIRFTGAEKFSILVKDHNAPRKVVAVLYSYTSEPEALSLEDTKLSAGNGTVQEMLFSSLTTSTEYVAYIYCDNSSNTDLYEVGIKKPASSGPVAVTSIAIAPSPATVKVGKTVTLAATITPNDATDKTVSWSVKSGGTYASVNATTGVVTGLAEGTAVITATANDGSGVTEDVTVNVENLVCPTSGEVFSMVVTSSSTVRPPRATDATHPGWLDLTDYATISGYGEAKAGNIATGSDKGGINSTAVNLDGNDGVFWVALDCPLQEGDIITATVTGNTVYLTPDCSRASGITLATGTDVTYTVLKDDKLDGESNIYGWKGGGNAKISAFSITRPTPPATHTLSSAVDPTGKGTVTLGTSTVAEGATTTATYSAIDAAYEFDEWQISGTGASIDDASANPVTVTMGTDDATITLKLKLAAPKYDITYYPGTGGSGSIDPAKKTKDVDFILSSERFTRAGYLQTGWATADGGAKVYELGATYTENADLDLYPFWTELDTYVASFACDDAAPAGWTFSNDGWADNVATAAYVCKFVENGIGTPKTTTGDGTEDDNVAFAKNAGAIATYDLGITTTVAALNVVLNGGSGSAFNETIEYLGADGSTVKQSYTNSLSAGNWKDNTISKTDVVADVRYIRVHGASKWVVMKSFSVSYIETRTKYDVAFAAGTSASGTMPTLHYAEGAEVVLPAATFTPPTDKEFDAWTSSDVTITDGKFTMPASDVTVTATWKDAITRYDVTFDTNGGSSIAPQEVEANGHPTAVANPTKDNYVFVGWFNNSDLAPEHAVADITALTITDDITLYAKWQLDIRLRQLVFSNGFDAFIKNNEVKAYYMEGTSAPTMVSYQGVNLKDVADAVTIVGNKVRMVGTDDSVIELDLILEAVTPMSSYDKQIFDGTETYVKTGNEFSTTSGKLGWKFSKNDGDWSRETPGQNRIYFFVGGSADRATFTSGASSRAIKVYVNNELVSSVETTAAAGSTFDIPLPAANAYNMIAIISNQTSGDGSVTDIQLNEHVISTDVSLSSLTVNGNAVTLVPGQYTYTYELPYGTVDAPTVIAVANAAPYATVSAITVDGTTKATFTVTAESSATQDYVVNFTIARFPTIALWDGSTMTAVVANGDPSLNGITWASTGVNVTSFSAKTCADNGKSYTKALDFGGNTKATRQFNITIPDGNVARISLVCNAKGTGARSISVGTDLAGVIDENAVSSIETADNTNLFAVAFDFFAAGTLFINTTDGFQVHEITIQMAPGYGRSAMLGNGVLGTVCVPNNVAVEDIQGATFYELAGKNDIGKIAFDQITTGQLEAGVPYVFQAHGNHIALLYGATSVTDPVDLHNGMYGTFTPLVLTELNDVYYFAQSALWSCTDLTSLSIPANRAYVKLSEIPDVPSASPAPGRIRMTLNVNGAPQVGTGMENLENSETPVKMMIDGRLYILRGEKLYDAQGRLVK